MDIGDASLPIAELVSFSSCCHLFDKLKSACGGKTKMSILTRFIDKWSCQFTNSTSEAAMYPGYGPATFYPILRLLSPQHDRARSAYGLREYSVARLYINAFIIPPKSQQALNILHPSKNSRGSRKDFADSLADALHGRCATQGCLSVKDVNHWLDQLASSQSQEERSKLSQNILPLLTATEHKWIVRLIVRRNSCCGLSAPQILQCLHPAAPGLWDITQDLYLLCQRIADIDPKAPIGSSTMSSCNESLLFVPFRPMLCERANSVELLCSSAKQLCSLADYDALPQTRVLLETKFDGERVQVHRSHDNYRYWSRNCLEWTESYGQCATSATSSFTPRLHLTFAPHVRECILDGEMMAYDRRAQKIMCKTSGFDVKRGTSTTNPDDYYSDYQPCLIVFDILHLNGLSLCKRPLLERKQLLAEAFNLGETVTKSGSDTDVTEEDQAPCPALSVVREGTVYIAGWCLSPICIDNIRLVFDQLINDRQEGLVAKLAVGSSPYLPGRRLSGGWWKLKPDYVSGMLVDLDCLVIGGFYSSPFGGTSKSVKQNKRVRQLLCGVRSDETEDSGLDSGELRIPGFLSFCRVSSGLTNLQWNVLDAELGAHWQPYDRRKPNCGMTEWLRVTSERPDVWIAPQYSICLQIHASELMSSRSYAAGLTPRFPRVVAVREDKSWRDCLTVVELTRLNENTEGKLFVKTDRNDARSVKTSSNTVYPSVEVRSKRSRTSFVHTAPSPTFASASIPGSAELSDSGIADQGICDDHPSPCSSSTPVKKLRKAAYGQTSTQTAGFTSSSSLENIEFCLILSADVNATEKSHLETQLRSFDAIVVQNPTSNTSCIISDKLTVRTRNLVRRSGNEDSPHDIVHLSWLKYCLDSGLFCPQKPSDFIATKSATRSRLHRLYDRFGDSFTELSDVTSLRKLLLNPNSWKDNVDKLTVHKILSSQSCPAEMILLSRPLFGSIVLPLCLSSLPDRCSDLVNRLLLIDLERIGAVVLNRTCPASWTIEHVSDQLKDHRSTNMTIITHVLVLDEVPIVQADDTLTCLLSSGSLQSPPKWVCRSWATDCLMKCAHLAETDYLAHVID